MHHTLAIQILNPRAAARFEPDVVAGVSRRSLSPRKPSAHTQPARSHERGYEPDVAADVSRRSLSPRKPRAHTQPARSHERDLQLERLRRRLAGILSRFIVLRTGPAWILLAR